MAYTTAQIEAAIASGKWPSGRMTPRPTRHRQIEMARWQMHFGRHHRQRSNWADTPRHVMNRRIGRCIRQFQRVVGKPE